MVTRNVILLRFKDANKSINNRTKSILIYIKVANPDISLEENEMTKENICIVFWRKRQDRSIDSDSTKCIKCNR